jgi:amidase
MVERSEVPVDATGLVPDGLVDAFWQYEDALMTDDLARLDALFAPGPGTLRGDAAGLLVGHDAISAFRRGRGGAPKRTVLGVHIRPVDADDALVVAEISPHTGGRGQQTQLWRRGIDGWHVVAAHVSGPAPAVDSRIWRVVGTPLLTGAQEGPLAGARVAVKDLFAVAGQRIGGGVPAYFAEAREETGNAPAVQQLLDAGAVVTGIARTDEFAYSIAGANPHYGTPPNGAVPGALPGGSSSGPATAVATGQADIGLATDTAGSIRVPASYQGIWGLRTTHGVVPTGGLLPLAPSFDTVGWLTRDVETLLRVAAVALPHGDGVPREVAIVPELLAGVDAEGASIFRGLLDRLVAEGRLPAVEEVELGDLDETFAAFRTVQAAEAWRAHGEWLGAHPGAVSGAVAERFRIASEVTETEEAEARAVLSVRRSELRRVLAERTLLLPAAASIAPQTTASSADIDRARTATLRITCLAGVAGAPSVSAPLAVLGRAPLGLALVGSPGSDRSLVAAAAALA